MKNKAADALWQQSGRAAEQATGLFTFYISSELLISLYYFERSL